MANAFKGEIKIDVRENDDTGCAAWSPYGGRIDMPTYIDVEKHLAAAMARD